MAGEELIEKTKRAFEAWSSGDAGVMAAELADDVEWTFPGHSAIGGTKHGTDEVYAHWARFGAQLRGPSGGTTSPTVSASSSSTPSSSTPAHATGPTF